MENQNIDSQPGTFKREITFLSNEWNGEKFEKKLIKKTATFNDFNDNDPSQHKLQFKAVSLFQNSALTPEEVKSGNGKMKIDTDALYDLAVLAIKTLLITDSAQTGTIDELKDKFTDQDKVAFLNSGSAILEFALWFLQHKLVDFFPQSLMSSPS